MIKGASPHFLDFTSAELGDLAWLAGGIYIEQNRFPNTVFARQCFLLIEDEDIRNKVRTRPFPESPVLREQAEGDALPYDDARWLGPVFFRLSNLGEKPLAV